MAKDIQASVIIEISLMKCIVTFIELNLSSYKLRIRILIFFLDGSKILNDIEVQERLKII